MSNKLIGFIFSYKNAKDGNRYKAIVMNGNIIIAEDMLRSSYDVEYIGKYKAIYENDIDVIGESDC